VSSALTTFGSAGVLWTIIFGSAGVLGWLRNRSRDEKNARTLGKFNESVKFWKTWLEANAVADHLSNESIAARERASERLVNLSQAMDELAGISSPPLRIGWIRFFICFVSACQPFSSSVVLAGYVLLVSASSVVVNTYFNIFTS
jgi:hypothetical protein